MAKKRMTSEEKSIRKTVRALIALSDDINSSEKKIKKSSEDLFNGSDDDYETNYDSYESIVSETYRDLLRKSQGLIA